MQSAVWYVRMIERSDDRMLARLVRSPCVWLFFSEPFVFTLSIAWFGVWILTCANCAYYLVSPVAVLWAFHWEMSLFLPCRLWQNSRRQRLAWQPIAWFENPSHLLHLLRVLKLFETVLEFMDEVRTRLQAKYAILMSYQATYKSCSTWPSFESKSLRACFCHACI